MTTDDKAKRQGREEPVREDPGPDPVHPQASRPVAGKSPEELRKREEERMTQDRREQS
ncbi:hypothetical protein [Streptomyces antimicrobicus]|uniref:Uncharacterized protein n=1 Tax=Streptomyces antimicrobicus TaxID=2883108 RepID=A0ABS8BBS1_9ACTN|nr:hypothetical protein [Streptomyces antimicrobicus]MCB5181981.1 hypothetical protein [Streptomyces antimicrobicus]